MEAKKSDQRVGSVDEVGKKLDRRNSSHEGESDGHTSLGDMTNEKKKTKKKKMEALDVDGEYPPAKSKIIKHASSEETRSKSPNSLEIRNKKKIRENLDDGGETRIRNRSLSREADPRVLVQG